MEEVSAFEAKTHLSKLLRRVQQGEKFTITKHGVPVAVICPVDENKPQDINALIKELRDLRGKTNTGPGSIRDLVQQGRRF